LGQDYIHQRISSLRTDLKSAEEQLSLALSNEDKLVALERMKQVEFWFRALASEIPEKYSIQEHRFVDPLMDFCTRTADDIKAKIKITIEAMRREQMKQSQMSSPVQSPIRSS